MNDEWQNEDDFFDESSYFYPPPKRSRPIGDNVLSQILFSFIRDCDFEPAIEIVMNTRDSQPYSVNVMYDNAEKNEGFTAFGQLLVSLGKIYYYSDKQMHSGIQLFSLMLSKKLVDLKKICMHGFKQCVPKIETEDLELFGVNWEKGVLPFTATVCTIINKPLDDDFLVNLFLEIEIMSDVDEGGTEQVEFTPLIAAVMNDHPRLFKTWVMRGASRGLNRALCLIQYLPQVAVGFKSEVTGDFLEFVHSIYDKQEELRSGGMTIPVERVDLQSKKLYFEIYAHRKRVTDLIAALTYFSTHCGAEFHDRGLPSDFNYIGWYHSAKHINTEMWSHGCEKYRPSGECDKCIVESRKKIHKNEGRVLWLDIIPRNIPLIAHLTEDAQKAGDLCITEQHLALACVPNCFYDFTVHQLLRAIDSHPDGKSFFCEQQAVAVLRKIMHYPETDCTDYIRFLCGRKYIPLQTSSASISRALAQLGSVRHLELVNSDPLCKTKTYKHETSTLWLCLWYGYDPLVDTNMELGKQYEFCLGKIQLNEQDSVRTSIAYWVFKRYLEQAYRTRTYAFLRALNYMCLTFYGTMRQANCLQLFALYYMPTNFTENLRGLEIEVAQRWCFKERYKWASIANGARQSQFQFLLEEIKE